MNLRDKIKGLSLIILIAAPIIIPVYFLWLKPVYDEMHCKVGKIYKYEFDKGNPYEKDWVKYYRVIDINNGYVLYLDSLTGDTLNSKIKIFLYGAEELN